MFVRVKNVGPYQYLQIAQNRREGKRVKQSVIATLGRLDKLTASGAIDQLLRSAARFAERVMVLSEHSRDAHDRPDANVVSIGPALIFERLWRETGCQEVVRELLAMGADEVAAGVQAIADTSRTGWLRAADNVERGMKAAEACGGPEGMSADMARQARRNGSSGVVDRRKVTGWIAREPGRSCSCPWAKRLERGLPA